MLHRRSIMLLPSFIRRCFSKKYPLRTQTGSMSSGQEKIREELDAMARQGKTVVPGGTGGKNLEAQENLAQGRSKGGNTRKKQLGTEGYQEIGSRGGEARKEQLGTGGYKELGRRGGQSKKEEHMDRKGERGDGVEKTERYGGEVVREKGDDSNFAWKGI